MAKLTEVDQKLTELAAMCDTLRAAMEAGCDDLLACADSPYCPLPFTSESDDSAKGSTDGCY